MKNSRISQFTCFLFIIPFVAVLFVPKSNLNLSGDKIDLEHLYKESKKEYVYWINCSELPCKGVSKIIRMDLKKDSLLEQTKWEKFTLIINQSEKEIGNRYRLSVRKNLLKNGKEELKLIGLREYKLYEELLIGGMWWLDSIRGKSVHDYSYTSGDWFNPRLLIDTEYMKISGADGCNQYSGTIKSLEKNELEIASVYYWTEMGCPGKLRDDYYKTLEDSKQFKIEGRKLIIYNRHGKEIITYVR